MDEGLEVVGCEVVHHFAGYSAEDGEDGEGGGCAHLGDEVVPDVRAETQFDAVLEQQ